MSGFNITKRDRLVGLILVIWISFIDPRILIWFIFTEIGVILLPMLHGFQHLHRSRFGIVGTLLNCLARYKIIVSKEEHDSHHHHDNTKAVYSSFMTSGVSLGFLMWFDPYIDAWWQAMYHHAKNHGKFVADMVEGALHPISLFLFIVIPILFAYNINTLLICFALLVGPPTIILVHTFSF